MYGPLPVPHLDHSRRTHLRGGGTGVFVEYGAQSGVKDSATLLLESYHGWSGLLVEPSTNCCDEVP